MSEGLTPMLWGLGWLLLTLAVFAAPLWPAWRELRDGVDASPLAIDDLDDGHTSYRARVAAKRLPVLERDAAADGMAPINRKAVLVRQPLTLHEGEQAEMLVSTSDVVVQPGSRVTRTLHARRLRIEGAQLPVRASADEVIALAPGSRFFRLGAPLIETALQGVAQPPVAEGAGGRAIERRVHRGNLQVPAGQSIQAHLVVHGDIVLEEGACIVGDVKAHGNVRLAPGAWLEGALFAVGAIAFESDNWAHGPVCAGRDVRLGKGFRGGSQTTPCSVSGWQVFMADGVRVHGSVTAVSGGQVLA
ncbi:MAG: hypothetical protein Q4G71_16250 [Pseudomonadota bacterium]|nr:hypothetical protein [Pseudomonadota bacterium]